MFDYERRWQGWWGSNKAHIALRTQANYSLAAAGLHKMAGDSDLQCKTEIRCDLSYLF